jgi:hypothetical protein
MLDFVPIDKPAHFLWPNLSAEDERDGNRPSNHSLRIEEVLRLISAPLEGCVSPNYFRQIRLGSFVDNWHFIRWTGVRSSWIAFKCKGKA